MILFLLSFIDFNKKISWHKQMNISFYEIKYLDKYQSFNVLVFILVIVNDFFYFIYIDNYGFIWLDV